MSGRLADTAAFWARFAHERNAAQWISSWGEHTPPVRVTPARYDMTVMPTDCPDVRHFTLAVEHRGHGLWSVRHLTDYLDTSGAWDPEPHPMQRHLFSLADALALAEHHAPHVSCNGVSAAEWLLRKEGRDA